MHGLGSWCLHRIRGNTQWGQEVTAADTVHESGRSFIDCRLGIRKLKSKASTLPENARPQSSRDNVVYTSLRELVDCSNLPRLHKLSPSVGPSVPASMGTCSLKPEMHKKASQEIRLPSPVNWTRLIHASPTAVWQSKYSPFTGSGSLLNPSKLEHLLVAFASTVLLQACGSICPYSCAAGKSMNNKRSPM